ncbi:MAG: hypothetical protein K2X27_05625 [Candidatus Obscuribacterales bacterium]|nr:hypothetical protein [Candidatus Obscuribacterales bacterium]
MPKRSAPSAPMSGRDQVMLAFQKASLEMTCNFLETQQRVMLAYLSSGGNDNAGVTNLLNEVPAINSGFRTIIQEPLVEYNPQTINLEPVKAESTKQGTERITTLPQTSSSIEPAQIMQSVETVAVAASRSSSKINEKEKLNVEQLVESLIEIVSERTGYPPEMLEPTLDLEADLGIDSIKRVEILNSFRKLIPDHKQEMLEEGIEKLAGIKTLQGIIDWIKDELGNEQEAPSLKSVSIEPQDLKTSIEAGNSR